MVDHYWLIIIEEASLKVRLTFASRVYLQKVGSFFQDDRQINLDLRRWLNIDCELRFISSAKYWIHGIVQTI